jgi:hypothetical protein
MNQPIPGLDALQAELEWCIAEGHSGPRTHACLKSMQPLIDRLRKAEAALNPRLWTKEMDKAWHTSIPNTMLAFERLRDTAAAPASTPTANKEDACDPRNR